jgi:hypothetical protein
VRQTRDGVAFDASGLSVTVGGAGVSLAVGPDRAADRNRPSLPLAAAGCAAEAVEGGARCLSEAREDWFLAAAGGVEHMIIVDDVAPLTSVPVDFGALRASLESETSVAALDDEGHARFYYDGLAVWDAFHRPQTAWFDVKDGRLSIEIETDDTTVGPLTIDPLVSQGFIVTSGSGNCEGAPSVGLCFGAVSAVADFNGDGFADVVVGAPVYGNGQANEGKAEIFLGTATGLATTASTTFEPNVANAECGRGLAAADVDDDGDIDIVIGCSSTDQLSGGLNGGRGGLRVHLNGNGTNNGNVGTWSTTPNLTFVDAVDSFEYLFVDLVARDFDGDGAFEIYANAQRLAPAGAFLHVYRFSAGAAPVQRFQVGGTSSGNTVQLEDINLFNAAGIVVSQSNQAQVFQYNTVTNALDTTPIALVPATPISGVATVTLAVGDINGDNVDDIVLGTPNEASFAGRVRVYRTSGGNAWVEETPAIAGSAGDNMGSTVFIADLNRDLHEDLLFCAEDEFGFRGRCRVYGGSPTGLNRSVERLTRSGAPTPSEGIGRLGFIHAAGNLEGDGEPTLDLLLARGTTNSVEVIDGDPATLKSTNEILPESNQSFGFGRAVAMGDLNNDGFDDVAVGGSGWSTGRGAVFVMFGGPTADNVPDWCTKGSNATDAFGSALAVAKVRGSSAQPSLIVGAPEFDDTGLTNSGRIEVFHAPLTGGCNLSNAPLTVSQSFKGTVNNGRYGAAVANAANAINGNGDGVIVGAPAGKTGTAGLVEILPSAGAAGLTSTGKVQFLGSDAAINCNSFGSAVAGAGNVEGSNSRADLLVGADGCDSGGFTDNGKAFLIRSNTSAPLLSLSTWTFAGVASGDGLSTVAGLGDVSGDGVADFAVGAPLEANGAAADAGRVRVFRGHVSSVPSTTQAISMSTATNGSCGAVIVGNVDFNRDGRRDLAIGEPTNGSGATNGGRLRVFFGNATGLIDATPEVTINGSVTNGQFASALAVGDLKGDLYGDIAIVEPGYTNPTANEGRVFVRSGDW